MKPEATHDPLAVMRIRHLPLRARAVMEGFYNGLHRSPFHGSSVEFSEYRPYSPGDDVRRLDWKRYARTDRYYIKRFEDETNRNVYVMLDRSRSMNYRTLEYDKGEYSTTLAATLAYYFSLQRDSLGLMTFDQQIGDFIPAQQRRGHLRRWLAALSRPLAGNDTDLLRPLQQMAQLIRKRGLVILISDFLSLPPPLDAGLGLLRARGHDVMLLRVLDPGEKQLRIDQPTTVVDLETGREMFLDPLAAADGYQQRFQQHRQQVEDTAKRWGAELFELVTDQPLAAALFQVVSAQRIRGGRPSRRGPMTSGRRATITRPAGGAR